MDAFLRVRANVGRAKLLPQAYLVRRSISACDISPQGKSEANSMALLLVSEVFGAPQHAPDRRLLQIDDHPAALVGAGDGLRDSFGIVKEVLAPVCRRGSDR